KALKKALTTSELLGSLLFEERDDVLVGSDGATLKRFRDAKPKPRPEFGRALDVPGDATVRVAAALPPALRRSLKEALPTLPRELGGARTRLIAEGVEWVAVGFDVPPKASLHVMVKGVDAATAKALREMAVKVFAALGKDKEVRRAFPAFDKVTELLTPRVE